VLLAYTRDCTDREDVQRVRRRLQQAIPPGLLQDRRLLYKADIYTHLGICEWGAVQPWCERGAAPHNTATSVGCWAAVETPAPLPCNPADSKNEWQLKPTVYEAWLA
jgi:hypothetical protein